MIRFVLLQNRQGRTRLAKYYVPMDDAEKHGIGTSDYSTSPGADLVELIENSRELLAKSKTALRKRDGQHRP